ncbi:MAG TPA: glycosyl hydrolase [Solirubrobacteraceae bacterium]|nr:glycosyl hydrolase [Solirubrobacteraceae bacterium]
MVLAASLTGLGTSAIASSEQSSAGAPYGGAAYGGAGNLSAAGSLTGAIALASPPVLGESETLQRVSGRVSVRAKGALGFTLLSGAVTVPDGSEVDTTAGSVAVTVATPQPGQTSTATPTATAIATSTATATASQGRFVLHQDPSAPAQAHLTLSGVIKGCAHQAKRSLRGRLVASAASRGHAAPRRPKSRHLWVSDQGGSWGTNGHYVATTVEGTRWLTIDRCTSSQVKVTEGKVLVHDLIHNVTVEVKAGKSYTASRPFAEGRALVPPLGRVYTGVTGGSVSAFGHQVGKHPAILGFFATWGADTSQMQAFSIGASEHTRVLLHISTSAGYNWIEEITPAGIARGLGDSYLIGLGAQIAEWERPAYVALMPEMNQTNNAYSAFNANGSHRDSSHSTANFKQAWRRSVLILRGGSVASIDRRLSELHLPAVKTGRKTLATPRLALLWAPQTAGTPDIPANSAAAYYPGARYVDIVGTDFYSAFPNFAGLERMYAQYPTKRFGFNEWAMWKNGDPGFVKRFFAFMRTHPRVAMILYNQGLNANGPFRLHRFPAAAAELRRQLGSPRFLPYTPDWAR